MLNISKRVKNLPVSPIRKLSKFAKKAKSNDIEIFHLNIGQPDIKTPKLFIEKINEKYDDIVAYTDSEGFQSHREAYANYYERYNQITSDEVIVTQGASEAIIFALHTLFDPGDKLLIPEPFYANYSAFEAISEIEIIPIETKLEENFEIKNIEQIISKIDNKTKGILICNPANPTGKIYTKKELELFENICKQYNLYLIVDEVYKEFCYNNQKFISAFELTSIHDKIVVIDSISKKFSACGARIGYFVSKNQEILKSTVKMAQARLCASQLGQYGAEALLGLEDDFYEKTLEEYNIRRRVMIESLKKIPGVKVPEVFGAIYILVELPVEDSEDFCRWMLTDFNHNGQTVMMAPGAGFYKNTSYGKNQVRVAYVLNTEKIEKAIECLKIGLDEYNKLR